MDRSDALRHTVDEVIARLDESAPMVPAREIADVLRRARRREMVTEEPSPSHDLRCGVWAFTEDPMSQEFIKLCTCRDRQGYARPVDEDTGHLVGADLLNYLVPDDADLDEPDLDVVDDDAGDEVADRYEQDMYKQRGG